jgi:hypothetical protein
VALVGLAATPAADGDVAEGLVDLDFDPVGREDRDVLPDGSEVGSGDVADGEGALVAADQLDAPLDYELGDPGVPLAVADCRFQVDVHCRSPF